MLLTSLPLWFFRDRHLTVSVPLKTIARLACLIHAASVHSEPGSNSPKIYESLYKGSNDFFILFSLEIDPRKSRRDFLWPRPSSAWGRLRTPLENTLGIFSGSLGYSIIKEQNRWLRRLTVKRLVFRRLRRYNICDICGSFICAICGCNKKASRHLSGRLKLHNYIASQSRK